MSILHKLKILEVTPHYKIDDAFDNNFGILRLILALAVVLGHFKLLQGVTSPSGIFAYADLAVDAFFVISGYLVAGSFERKTHLGSFYIRRFFRIYPLYFFMVVLQAIGMLIALGGIEGHGAGTASYLGWNLIFLNFMEYDIDKVLAPLVNPGINPSLWTLKIEVGFYIMLPFLWLAYIRFGLLVPVIVFVLSTLYAWYFDMIGQQTLAKQLPAQLRFFTVGVLLYHYRHKLHFAPIAAIALAFILLAVCSMRHMLPIMALYPVFIGLFVFLVATQIKSFPIRFDISYGVYLIHAPLLQFALLAGVMDNTVPHLLALLFVTIILAFFVEQLIELPGIRFGKIVSDHFAKTTFSQKIERVFIAPWQKS